MVVAQINNRESLAKDYKKVLITLGIDILQKYILQLGLTYRQNNNIPFYRIDSKIINEGSRILTLLIKHKLISIDSTKNSLIYLRPADEFQSGHIDKIYKIVEEKYPIYSEVLTYTNKWVKSLNKPIIKNYTGIAKVNHSNKQILEKLSNISFKVTSEFSDYPRIPKNGIASIDTNYLLETHIQKQTQKDYNGEIIYFPFQYDKRGRIYCQSYRLNTQSDEWNKACLNLGFKEKVNPLGMIALKKDIAIQYGLDKKTTIEKLRWFEANKDYILKVANENILDKQADKPILFQKACKAYRDAIDNKPIGYMCSIDATASGLQILSILTRDKESAKFTNLSAKEQRFDIYTEFAKNYLTLLGKEISHEKLAKARKVLKPCVMTHFYNSIEGIKQKLGGVEEYYNTFIDLIKEMCVGPNEFLEYVKELYYRNSNKKYFAWTMPDGFEVVIEQEKDMFYKVNSPYYSCIFKYQGIEVNEEQNNRKLAAHIVHSIDSFICRELIRRCNFEISPIHDSFYAHPNNINVVLSTYQNILQEINVGKYQTLLSDILSDIAGQKIENPFEHKEPLEDIRNSFYCLS